MIVGGKQKVKPAYSFGFSEKIDLDSVTSNKSKNQVKDSKDETKKLNNFKFLKLKQDK